MKGNDFCVIDFPVSNKLVCAAELVRRAAVTVLQLYVGCCVSEVSVVLRLLKFTSLPVYDVTALIFLMLVKSFFLEIWKVLEWFAMSALNYVSLERCTSLNNLCASFVNWLLLGHSLCMAENASDTL